MATPLIWGQVYASSSLAAPTMTKIKMNLNKSEDAGVLGCDIPFGYFTAILEPPDSLLVTPQKKLYLKTPDWTQMINMTEGYSMLQNAIKTNSNYNKVPANIWSLSDFDSNGQTVVCYSSFSMKKFFEYSPVTELTFDVK